MVKPKPGRPKSKPSREDLLLARKMNPKITEWCKEQIQSSEKLANLVLGDRFLAMHSDIDGNSLAHISVATWQSAAKRLIDDYADATSSQVPDINDKRILIAQQTNVFGVSVKDVAEGTLKPTTPRFLRTGL